MSLLFDVPPRKPESTATEQLSTTESGLLTAGNKSPSLAFTPDPNADRPALEAVLDWEEAKSMLPQDYKRKTDWSAALNQGLIRPRTGVDASAHEAAAFKYDFFIPAEKPKNEAYFPHSAHTVWLGCKNCHASLYRYKRNPSSMKQMKKGASCGACHGGVAFSLKQCKRCHLNR